MQMDHLPEKPMKPVTGNSPGETREAVCPEHGVFVARNIVRSIWSRCRACEDVDTAERDRLDAERGALEADARHREAVGMARIPLRFLGNSFESFVVSTDAQRHALTVVRDFAENFNDNGRKGLGLMLAGAPGTGKTHLATATLQRLIAKRVCYMTCMDLIRSMRDTWRHNSDQTGTQLLRYLVSLDLLVIDEVGVQYGSASEKTILFDVVDLRYREKRSTMLVTNQDAEGFEGLLGDRSFDRIKQTNTWVPFDWPSYRPTARRAEA